MKKIVYNMIACCMAALLFAGCEKECDMPGGKVGGDGNSIILNLSSGSLPVSRAVETTAAEVKVSHIDVLIFEEDGNKAWHERVGGSETGSRTIALKAKRSSFNSNEKYWVYLIANSTAEESVFSAEDFNRNSLLSMHQEDPAIHMTGLANLDVPQTFLMDGVAYPDGQNEPSQSTTVVLNNGVKSDDTRLKVTLRRAAAKLVIRIHKGEFVDFDNSPSAYNAGYYLRNMPYTTSVVVDGEGEAQLRTPDLNSNSYFNWAEEVITVTAYAYAHEWENASALEKEVRLIVNIPMYYIPHDADGTVTGEAVPYTSSYYQIPVCRGKALERNTCYEVTLTLNVPGGTNPLEPVKLEADYIVLSPWEDQQINIGGEEDLPAYLTLNENEMEMHNIEDDHSTLQFTSSSAVDAAITKVYFIDKFGKEQVLTKIPNSTNEYGIEGDRGNWTNRCTVRITPDEGINGKVDIYSTIPENNTIRYIEFDVTNENDITRSVKVAQYPLVYIVNVEGWYSYRDDFVSTASDGTSGVTTWELLAGKKINKGQQYSSSQVPYDNNNAWICGCSWNNGRWSYSKTGTGFFGSKVVNSYNATTGLSDIEYARWEESRSGNSNYIYNTTTGSVSLNNHRMYHVFISVSSNEYTLGQPRITAGKTDPGKDNAVLVSPSFMLASQLGAVMDADNVDIAASHCEQYVEVARDGTVYNDWRLPTAAEVKIIYKYQNDSDAMDEVLSGESYWSASGEEDNPDPTDAGTKRIRCIRDAYNDKKSGN